MRKHYRVGRIKAVSVAIGDHPTIKHKTRLDAKQISMQTEALHQIRQLIELLPLHAAEIDNLGKVQAHAESVEAALKKNKPKRARIMNLADKLRLAVAGVTTLANAVDAVKVAASHL